MKTFPVLAWTKGYRNFETGSRNFSRLPWAQGVILLSCVLVAMLLANLPFTRDFYHSVLATDLSISILIPGHEAISFPRGMTVETFVNDILMVVFFFTVGLEIRREMVSGELSTPRKAIMPIIAALGGVLAPALIYIAVNHGTFAAGGWGIPTATDIAFAVGVMSILGDKVPVSLKVFLTALAIADDLIAILVVAIFYGGTINFRLLGIALILILLILAMRYLREKRTWFYFIPSIAIWILFYYSGVHATMSGVVMAFLLPMEPRYSKAYFIRHEKLIHKKFVETEGTEEDNEAFPNVTQRYLLRKISSTSKGSISLTDRLEYALGPWVNFLIMPLFALANAGVQITDPSYFNIFRFIPEVGGVGMGIFLGLVVGKPFGITLASWIAVKTKLGAMPDKATWPMLAAVACLGGIGFTMSIFVDTLSFGEHPESMQQMRDMGKIAILLGSLGAGVLGSLLISLVHKK